jgi:hypothetical protein
MFDLGAGQAQDPQSAYSQLSQGQLQEVAQAFVNRLRGVNDPAAQQFAQADTSRATPQMVAEMHQYAAQHHPGILGEVMSHPILTGALTAFALHELRKHEGQSR